MKFSFAAPFNRFFQLVGDNFGLFFAVGVVGLILPSLALDFGLLNYYGMTLATLSESISTVTENPYGWYRVGAALLVSVLSIINLSMITEFAILRSVNKPVSVGAALSKALVNILPLIGISLSVGFIVLGGMILLIVPGIIWAVATMVAVPAYVGQRGLGVSGSVTRSFELTRGHRWVLFAVCLVALLAFMAAGGGAGYGIGLAQSGASPIVRQVLIGAETVLEGVLQIVSNIFVAAVYIALRESKDGATPSAAAAVF